MKKGILTVILTIHLYCLLGQSADVKAMVDSLNHLKADTLDCSADLYWRIVAQKEKAIPFLINRLTDTTATNIGFHCKKEKLNVGEVSYFALSQIMFLPVFLITNTRFDIFYGKGCWSFYDYLFNDANKSQFQQELSDWYVSNMSQYKAVKLSKKKLSECQKYYNIDTFLMLKD